jgi:hypothetical protein
VGQEYFNHADIAWKNFKLFPVKTEQNLQEWANSVSGSEDAYSTLTIFESVSLQNTSIRTRVRA